MPADNASPRIVAVVNQKGGRRQDDDGDQPGDRPGGPVGERVLVVDADAQGNASTGLGIDHADRVRTTYDLLLGKGAKPVATGIEGLAVIPATADLSGAEVELVGLDDRHARLKKGLAKPARKFDLVLIDCPPSLSLLTLNALVAAHEVLVPLQCEFFALEGLSSLLGTVERVRRAHNPDLHVSGIVLTMFDRRTRLSHEVIKDVRTVMGDVVYDAVIPRNIRVSEAPSFGKPVILHDFQCSGAQAYLRLATEMLRREKARARESAP